MLVVSSHAIFCRCASVFQILPPPDRAVDPALERAIVAHPDNQHGGDPMSSEIREADMPPPTQAQQAMDRHRRRTASFDRYVDRLRAEEQPSYPARMLPMVLIALLGLLTLLAAIL
jgi:hypothetical protein